jgi:hypothetical protein
LRRIDNSARGGFSLNSSSVVMLAMIWSISGTVVPEA